MANFKITATTTVAELKEQFRGEFGGILRVYQGRSEAPEDATLVSLGGKVGELECRASRTVGKFIEAFQSELGLKVKVYTKDNWVSVLDGITLATVREIPKNARKAQMEQYLTYQRDEKEDVTEEAKADEVEIPEEYKGVPIFEISMTEINVNDEELVNCDFPRYPTVGVVFHGYESNASQGCVIVSDRHSELCETAKEFIENEISEDEDIPVRVIETQKIEGYGKASDKEEFTGVIGCALNEYYDGGNKHSYEYEWEDWAFDKAIFVVDDDVFMGYSDGGIDFIDLDDKQIEALKIDALKANLDNFYFDDETGLAEIRLDDKIGRINRNGDIVVRPIYDRIGDFYDGLCMVCNDGKYGFLNEKGATVIPLTYDFLEDEFFEGLCRAKKDGKYGFINTANEVVIPFEYDQVYFFENGLSKVDKNGKSGFINSKNEIVIPIEYTDLGNKFSCGLCSVEKEGKYGFINTENKVVIPFEYDNLSCNGSFKEGLCGVVKDEKYGFIDTQNNIVIPIVYDWVGEFEDGTANVEKDGKDFKIDRNGNVVE